jgi:hypothetical protein
LAGNSGEVGVAILFHLCEVLKGDLASDAGTVGAEQQGRRDDRGCDLPRVGLNEEATIVEQQVAHAVAVLQVVAEHEGNGLAATVEG